MKKILSIIFTCICLAILLFSSAIAGDENIYATSEDGTREFTSISSAWEYACGGNKIILQRNWTIDSQLIIGSDKHVRVEMNGYKIELDPSDTAVWIDRSVIYMGENSSLILSGNLRTVDIDYYRFDISSFDKEKNTSVIRSGGLITGGLNNRGGGGIHALKGANITLDNVAIAGNKTSYSVPGMAHGGGVYLEGDNSNLTLKNGATIAYNVTSNLGGGVYVQGQNCNITLDDANISNNYARSHGGGVYFVQSNFNLSSTNKNSYINSNMALSYGGGVYIESQAFASNYGIIDGLTFDGNKCNGRGGGIYVAMESIRIKNSTFVHNNSGDGGGIAIENDDVIISDCTIQYNDALGKGGGIYSDPYNDITLLGKMIVTDNTRNKQSSDDLCLGVLEEPILIKVHSYLLRTPDEGSRIGVRIDDSSNNQLIGKEQTRFVEGMFFSDTPNSNHIEYDASNKQLYLKEGVATYNVYVNNASIGSFKKGDIVTIDGSISDDNYAFVKWTSASGVSLTDLEDINSVKTTFVMPENSVNLVCEYLAKAIMLDLQVEMPKAGKELTKTGKLTLIRYGETNEFTIDVDIMWLEKYYDGVYKIVDGIAKETSEYHVVAVVKQDLANGISFSSHPNETKVGYIDANGQVSKDEPVEYLVGDNGRLYMAGKDIISQEGDIVEALPTYVSISKDGDVQTMINELKEKLSTLPIYVKKESNSYKKVSLNIEGLDLSQIVQSGGTIEIGLDADTNLKCLVTVSILDKTDYSIEFDDSSMPGIYNNIDNIFAKLKVNNSNILNTTDEESPTTSKPIVYYKLNNYEPIEYSDYIDLHCKENEQNISNILAWVEVDDVKICETFGTFIIDNSSSQKQMNNDYYSLKIDYRVNGQTFNSEEIKLLAGSKYTLTKKDIDGKEFVGFKCLNLSKYNKEKSELYLPFIYENMEVVAEYKDVDSKDSKSDSKPACNENNQIWSETKKACVYRVTNTSVK